jgi:hypothetical protein
MPTAEIQGKDLPVDASLVCTHPEPGNQFLSRMPSPERLTEIVFARYTLARMPLPTDHPADPDGSVLYGVVTHPDIGPLLTLAADELRNRPNPSPDTDLIRTHADELTGYRTLLGFASMELAAGCPQTVRRLLTHDGDWDRVIPPETRSLYLGQLTINPLLPKAWKLDIHGRLLKLYEQQARAGGTELATYMICHPTAVVPFVKESGFRLEHVPGTALNAASEPLFSTFPLYWKTDPPPQFYRVVFSH